MSEAPSSEQDRPSQARQIGAFAAGVLLALAAAYIFYLHPWHGLSLPIDNWLAQQRCLVSNFCGDQSALPHHLGLLAVFTALFCFAIALSDERGIWAHAGRVTPWRTVGATMLAAIGGASIGIQAFQALIQKSTPGAPVWLVGVLALAAAVVLWDSARPALLAQTVAGLLLAAGMAALLIGAGIAFADPLAALWLLVPGAAAAVAGGLWADRIGGALATTDHLLMLGFGLLALLLGLMRIDSWRYAFIGDEWGFFELASTLLHRPELHTLFSVVDANAYHTVFSSSLQAGIMRLAGEDVYGWRLSSLLPLVLSVPAVYVFAHWLSGRSAAIAAAGLLASSHMLLSFSMVAYNNTQALLPLTWGLALFAYAERRDSALRFYALGAVLGASFLVFGLARLAILPVGILVLFTYWTSWRRALLSTLAAGIGALAVSAPILFNLDNWRGLLKATPVQSEALDRGGSVAAQMVRNITAGAQAFLVSDHNTHFVAGPHADPLTAILVLVGLAATLRAWPRRRAIAWLGASVIIWLAVSAIQQYQWVSTTRMYVLVPIYAIYAGLGVAAIAGIFFADEDRRRSAFVAVVVLVAVLLNQAHIVRVAHAQSRIPVEALLVREFQNSASADGSGIPIYVVWDQPYTVRENMILRAYGIERSRIRFITAEEALTLAALCDPAREQVLLVHSDAPALDAIRERARACWPLHEEMLLENERNEARLYRFMTLAGVQEVVLPQGQREADRPQPDSLAVPDPHDLVVDGVGHIFVLSKELPSVLHFDANGRLVDQFALQQEQPSALAMTPDGLLLVANSGAGPSLVWYDSLGHVVRRLPASGALGVPAGLSVTADGDILVADAALRQVVRLDADGRMKAAYTADGQLQQPFSVTAARGDTFWVLDGAAGRWLKLSAEDQVLASVATDRASASTPARLLTAKDGSVVISRPDSQRLDQIGPDGMLLDVRGGFKRPSSLAADGDGRLYVVDSQLDEVAILPPTGIDFDTATVAVRAEEAASMSYGDLRPYGDEFLSPLSPLPLAGVDDLADPGDQRYLPSSQIGGLTRPRAIAVGIDPADGVERVYVGDAAGSGMAVLSDEGELLRLADTTTPRLTEVSDLAVDSSGRVYALDAGAGALHRFTADGSYIGALAGDSGAYGDARGLFIDENDDLWISNTRGGVVAHLDSEGTAISTTPVIPGDDTQPVDVLVDQAGNLYVADARRARLLHLSSDGDLLGAWALSPFNSADAAHLAMDGDGTITVSQPEQGILLQLSPAGGSRRSWRVIRPDGSAAKPVGVAVDADGDLWTVDVDGGGVVVVTGVK